jgi:hypothetical protein
MVSLCTHLWVNAKKRGKSELVRVFAHHQELAADLPKPEMQANTTHVLRVDAAYLTIGARF